MVVVVDAGEAEGVEEAEGAALKASKSMPLLEMLTKERVLMMRLHLLQQQLVHRHWSQPNFLRSFRIVGEDEDLRAAGVAEVGVEEGVTLLQSLRP